VPIIHARRFTPPPAASAPDRAAVQGLADRLAAAAHARLGRNLAVRHVDGGSCNGCELELRMLRAAIYDLGRYGLGFVDSPRHADVLLVTGPVTRTMQDVLRRAHTATPDPKFVVAVGDCAIDGGVFKGSYALTGGVGDTLPVDLYVRGCPPQPAQILEALRLLIEANATATEA
jgi:Ni,Fe-hydrogenase III small subunit